MLDKRMGRKKINMELISNERSRTVTYQKRTRGLIKKMEEFHILCDVDACLIIIGPKSNHQPAGLVTWPTDSDEMKRIINRYREEGSTDTRVKKTQNLSDYFAIRKRKLVHEIAGLRKASMEAKFPRWSDHLNLLSFQQLKALDCVLDNKLEIAKRRVLEIMEGKAFMMDGPLSGSEGGPLLPHSSVTPSKYVDPFYQKIMEFKPLDVEFKELGRQPMSYPYHQMVPLNINPTPTLNTVMMKVNGADSTQSAGMTASSGSNIPYSYSPVIDSACYHPIAPTVENETFFNFSRAYTTVSYSGPSSQPLLPYLQAPMMFNFSPQKDITQFDDFSDLRGFGMHKGDGNF